MGSRLPWHSWGWLKSPGEFFSRNWETHVECLGDLRETGEKNRRSKFVFFFLFFSPFCERFGDSNFLLGVGWVGWLSRSFRILVGWNVYKFVPQVLEMLIEKVGCFCMFWQEKNNMKHTRGCHDQLGFLQKPFVRGDNRFKLLMAEILHQLTGSLSHCL